MGHMVIFRGTDGKPGYRQAEELSEAIQYVEHLRNDDGLEHARIFRLEEVSFEFRPYFRVEVGAGTAEPAPAMAEATNEWALAGPAEMAAVAAEPVPVEAPMSDAALTAMVGEPAGAPWPEQVEMGSAPDDTVGAANGARRGLFGR